MPPLARSVCARTWTNSPASTRRGPRCGTARATKANACSVRSEPAVAAIDSGLTSFVVVAADSGPLLGDCVDSVLAADDALELVLVDNASGDGSIERVLAAHSRDTRLRLLRNPANLGFGPACNRGA